MLSIIIPTYNEQATIEELVRYVQAVKYPIPHEIIIVDDASDKTNEMTTPLENVHLVKNTVNRGKSFSVREGIRRARGEIIVVQDADTEYDPHEIPKLLGPILDGKAEVVYGSRFLKARRPSGMAFPNWIANRFLTSVTNLLYGLNLTDMETCYKVFKADILKNLKLRSNRFAFEPEVTALLAKKKIPILELPISYHGRSAKDGKKIKARDFLFAVLMLLRHLF